MKLDLRTTVWNGNGVSSKLKEIDFFLLNISKTFFVLQHTMAVFDFIFFFFLLLIYCGVNCVKFFRFVICCYFYIVLKMKLKKFFF